MSDPMALKWALVDLLKVCDVAHEGRLHGDLARIARTLGVELSEPVAASWREDPVKWERDRALEQQAEADKCWKAEQERKMKAPRVKGVS